MFYVKHLPIELVEFALQFSQNKLWCPAFLTKIKSWKQYFILCKLLW